MFGESWVAVFDMALFKLVINHAYDLLPVTYAYP